MATTINYIDRQVISILKPDLQRELGWTEIDYSNIIFAFSLAYAISLLVSGSSSTASAPIPSFECIAFPPQPSSLEGLSGVEILLLLARHAHCALLREGPSLQRSATVLAERATRRVERPGFHLVGGSFPALIASITASSCASTSRALARASS